MEIAREGVIKSFFRFLCVESKLTFNLGVKVKVMVRANNVYYY